MSSNSGSGSAKWISIVVMVIGALMVIAGAVTYAQVSSTLADERITVSEDACLGGQAVSGPFAAYCEATDHPDPCPRGHRWQDVRRARP